MYRKGHLGVSLLVFAPVGYWLVTVGEPEMAMLTGAVMCWLAMLPDIDHRLPMIEHRGVTHSLLFVGLVGGVFGAAGVALSGAFSVAGVGLATFGFLLGVLTVGAHLLGDALTPAGVPLLWPFPRSIRCRSRGQTTRLRTTVSLSAGSSSPAAGRSLPSGLSETRRHTLTI